MEAVGRIGRMLGSALLALLEAGPAWAHPGEAPLPHELWTSWSPEPGVLLALGLAAVLYARGTRRVWNRAGVGRGIERWRLHCFAAGLAVLLLALVSPLDALGGALFSAHMAQHELLMLAAAPLLALGNPALAMLWALPRRGRRAVARLLRSRPWRAFAGALTRPLSAWALFAVALWTWHAPALYQATLRSELVHVAQHASFLGAAVLFWWVLFDPRRRRRGRRAGYGVGVLYVFTTAVHGSLLGALLTFARSPWYPAYAPTTRAWGLSPLEDQQLGGLIMWVPPGFVYLAVALAVMALWLRGMEPQAAQPAPLARGALRR